MAFGMDANAQVFGGVVQGSQTTGKWVLTEDLIAPEGTLMRGDAVAFNGTEQTLDSTYKRTC